MKSVALVANGELKSPAQMAHRIKNFQRIVAVDGGLLHCHEMRITPDCLIGDFDSCPSQLLAQYEAIPKQILPKEKDLTDLEAALQHELDQTDSLTIFAGWGGRIDHSLTNALILTRYPGKVYLETENEILFSLRRDQTLDCEIDQILSLLPINGPVKEITTEGLKWELQNGSLDHHFIGVSNICLQEKVRIQFKSGSLLCCLQRELQNSI